MTEEEAKPTLSQLTDSMSQTIGSSYSDGEEELSKITDQLTGITASSEFFEQEKIRMKLKADMEKAQSIRDAITLGEQVSNRERNWLEKFDLLQLQQAAGDDAVAGAVEATAEQVEVTIAEAAFEQDADLELASDDTLSEDEDSSVDDDLNSELHDEEV
jgi:hypothetical protein